MAFEGDLNDLALGDIFQTLAMTRQAGTLVVRGREERHIAFGLKGIAVLSRRDSIGSWIGNYLVGVGALDGEDLEKASNMRRKRREGFLGDILLELEFCEEARYQEACRYVAQEELFDLFLWKEGTFEFEPGEEGIEGPLAHFWFDVGGIAMEAARRMDETARLAEVIDLSLVLLPNQDVEIPEDLSTNDRRVLEALDGTKTTRAVFEDLYLGDFDCLKAVGNLYERGLVRSASLDEILSGATASISRKRYEHAARLYELACQIEPERVEFRSEAAEALVKAGEKRAASQQFAGLGGWHLQRGDNPAAVQAYQRAIRLDNSNADAHGGLMHALFERGETEDGVEAGRAASKAYLAQGDHDRALQIATIGLDHEPGDVGLRMTVANAYLGQGRTEQALEQLDDLASILETTGENDKRLLDVYRQIIHLDETRRDCLRRIEELQAYAQAKRKRFVQRASIGVGVLLLSLLAIPVLSGPGVESSILEAEELYNAHLVAEAGEVLAAVESMELDEEQRERVQRLRERMNPKPTDVGGVQELPELTATLEKLYREASDQIQQKRHVQALRLIMNAFDRIQQETVRSKGGAAQKRLGALKREASREAHLALSEIAGQTSTIASELAAARDQFSPEELRKADPAKMKALWELARKAAAIMAGDDWEEMEDVVKRVVVLAGAPGDKANLTVVESTIRILADAKHVAEQGDKALAEVRRNELANQFRVTRNETTRLIGEGKLNEAIELYKQFLSLCDDLQRYEPAELYETMRLTYLENLDLDGRAIEGLGRLDRILTEERAAAEALAAGDFATAWASRARLVTDNPNVNFERRFWLPLWVESHPDGADVYELRPGAPARKLGKTPMAVNCILVGPSRFAIRMDGFHEYVVERRGSSDTRGGVEAMDLVKVPLMGHEPDQSHTTEGAAASHGEAIYVAGRDGVVRRVLRANGQETARFETGLLDGFAGAPAIAGDSVAVAGLDGSAFVLDATTLERKAHIELSGPARASVIAHEEGFLIADEGGTVRRLSVEGKEVWKVDLEKVRVDGVLRGSTVYYTTVNGNLVALDAATGNRQFSLELSRNPLWGRADVHGQHAYVGCDDRTVVKVDLEKGSIVWRVQVDGPVAGRVDRVGDVVAVSTTTGSVHLLAESDGTETTRFLLGAPVRTGVLGLEEGFVVATTGGVVSRFSTSGDLVWRYDVQEPVRAPLSLHDGELTIVTRRGKILVVTP